MKKEDIEAIVARLLSKKEAAHFMASCFRNGFQVSRDEALAAVERQEQRRFEAAVAFATEHLRGGSDDYIRCGIEDADALLARLDGEVGDE